MIELYGIVKFRKLGPAIFKDMISYIQARTEIDYDDLPPNDQEKLENLCNAMNIATVAYKTSVDANDVDSTMHWEAEIAKIQESINNLLEGNRNFI